MSLLKDYLIICFLLISSTVSAQYYDAGHEPFSTRWRIISTEKFDLIYPDTFEMQAQQIACYLDSLIPLMQQNYRMPLRKIPVLLHNQMSVSNAFVGWAPARMEFYTIPPADGYAHDWLDQLCIHESTHWFQFSQMYQGLTGFLGRIFGEHLPAGIMGLYIPFWVTEGEAVHYETAHSDAGRGRDAGFEQLTRTRLVNHRPYSYDKAYLGSFRDITADHYELGYQLVSYGRMHFGEHLWDSVFRFVARNPYNPFAFYTAMKLYTGMGKAGFYKAAMKELSRQWRQLDSLLPSDTLARTLRRSKKWVLYHHPESWLFGEHIAERRSLKDVSAIVKISSNGSEKVLFYPGYMLGDGFSRCDERIYYTALSYHPRWPNIEYSDIWVYDGRYDTLARLTRGGRYFSPVEDPVAGELYAIRYHENHRFSLVRMSADAVINNETELPEGLAVSHASWWLGGDRFLFVGTSGNGKALYTWNGTDAPDRITPYTRANIDNPTGMGEGVLFEGAFDGVSQIYLFEPQSGKTFQITQSAFGAKNPAVDFNGELLYARVGDKGTEICSLSPEDFLGKEITWPSVATSFFFADTLAGTDASYRVMPDIQSNGTYDSKRYNAWKHLFRLHSWAPAFIDPDQTSVQPGVTFFSQNTLSTAFLKAGMAYDPDVQSREYFAAFIFKGFFPVITFRGSVADKMWFSHDTAQIPNFRYLQPSAELSFSIPLVFTKRQWNSYIRFETGSSLLAFTHLEDTYPNFIEGGLYYGFLDMYWHTLRRMAARDLYPRWGWSLDAKGITTLGGKLDAGNVMGINAVSYFPGIGRHHGLRVMVGWQNRVDGINLDFNRLVPLPRGYQDIEGVTRAISLQSTYKMPLLYPDFSLGPLLYVKRLSMAVFFDYMAILDGSIPRYYSYGFEAYADVHLLRHFAPVSLGYGVAFRRNKKYWSYPLLAVSFTI